MKFTILQQLATPILNATDIGYQGATQDNGLVLGILNTVYFWLGAVAVGMIVYGGYMYVISNADPGKVKKAKDVLLYAVIGVVIVLLAFAITNVVVKGLS